MRKGRSMRRSRAIRRLRAHQQRGCHLPVVPVCFPWSPASSAPHGLLPCRVSSRVKPCCPPVLPARGPERAGSSCRVSRLHLLGFLISAAPAKTQGPHHGVFPGPRPLAGLPSSPTSDPVSRVFRCGMGDEGRAGLPRRPGGGSFSVKGNTLYSYRPLHENERHHSHSRDGVI